MDLFFPHVHLSPWEMEIAVVVGGCMCRDWLVFDCSCYSRTNTGWFFEGAMETMPCSFFWISGYNGAWNDVISGMLEEHITFLGPYCSSTYYTSWSLIFYPSNVTSLMRLKVKFSNFFKYPDCGSGKYCFSDLHEHIFQFTLTMLQYCKRLFWDMEGFRKDSLI